MRVLLHRNLEFSSDFVLLCVFLANPRRRICHNINVKGGGYYQCLTTDRLPLLRRHFRVPHGNVEGHIYKPLRSGKEQVDCLVNRDHKTEHKNSRLIYPVAQFFRRDARHCSFRFCAVVRGARASACGYAEVLIAPVTAQPQVKPLEQ